MARNQGRADRTIAGLAQADDRAGGQKLVETAGEHAGDRCQTPGHRHHDDAVDPAGPVGEQCDRKAAEGDRHRHYRDEGAQLLVREAPVSLDVGERRDDDLAINIVEHHQSQRHRECEPGFTPTKKIVAVSGVLCVPLNELS